MSTKIDRRLFLGSLGAIGASALVPRLAHAQTAAPKRLLVVFSPNGTIYDAWKPTGTETNFTFGPILAPLEPFRSKVVVVDGIECRSAYNGPGDDHMKGMGHMLTGTELLNGTTVGGDGSTGGLAGGISIDQHIANVIGQNSRFKSLEFGVRCGGGDVWGRMIYAGANQPLPPMDNPESAYTRIFAGANLDQSALLRLLKRRKSVLDHATSTLGALQTRISAADRQRVQAHGDSIRSIEKQLLTQASACQPPTVNNPNLNDDASYKPIGRLMMDMITASFACDQTRVASLQFSRSVSGQSFSDIGVSDGHHDLSHFGDDNQDARDKLIKINNWYATEFAYLLGKLDAVTEADGSKLLDNTLILWVNELAKGNAHSHSVMPMVLAGKAAGALNTGTNGRYVKLPNVQPHNNLLVSVANAMGVNINTFGNPAYCTGKLAAL